VDGDDRDDDDGHLARTVLDRLERIGELERAGGGRGVLLGELRALLTEAEAWSRAEGGDAGEQAVRGLRSALARDMIAV
jgi:hypothetical protein